MDNIYHNNLTLDLLKAAMKEKLFNPLHSFNQLFVTTDMRLFIVLGTHEKAQDTQSNTAACEEYFQFRDLQGAE